MKDTFIIRTEWYAAITHLSEKEQALILKNLFEFHSGKHENIDTSTLNLTLVWQLIEPNLKRNIDKYDRRCETSKENGKLGGRPIGEKKPKKPKNKPNNPDSDSDSVSDSDSDTDINIPFDVFWNLYDKKKGDKEYLKEKWASFTNTVREEIIAYIPAYKNAQPDKQFRKDPKTFFNQKAWKDEIIERSTGNTPVVQLSQYQIDLEEARQKARNYKSDTNKW
jgi:hypothetical protein